MQGRVLIMAGSDSGGGAGIQADIKAVTALGAYAATAITALTAQNTRGVFGIHPVPVPFIRQQIRLVLDDIGADALKVGMLGTAEIITAVSEEVAETAATVPLVVDPVMVAKGGHRLLEAEASGALVEKLLPLAAVVTPNLPEAEVLTGLPVTNEEEMLAAAERLLTMGPKAVVMKGGHLPGETVVDLMVTPEGVTRFSDSRLKTAATHGTGCTLASALAAGLSIGMAPAIAFERARSYVRRAMETAPGLGGGHGPLNHGHTVIPYHLP